WDGTREAALARAFTGAPEAADSARRVSGWLDDRASAWVGAQDDACRAQARHEQTSAEYDRRSWCLDQVRDQLRSAVDQLIGAGGGALSRFADVFQTVGDPAACDDERVLAGGDPLPADPSLRLRARLLEARVADVHAIIAAGRTRGVEVEID